MIQKLKNILAHLDRELGFLLWKHKWKKQSLENHSIIYECLNTSESTVFFDYKINANFSQEEFFAHFGESYVLKYGSVSLIDSNTGWAWNSKQGLLKKSFPFAQFPWKNSFYPNHFLFKRVWSRKPAIVLDSAVNMLWYGWTNYYHFLIDIIPAINYLNSVSLKTKKAVLVPDLALELGFVQEFFTKFPALFHNIDFVYVPKNTLVQANELFLVKASRFDTRYLNPYTHKTNTATKNIFLYRNIASNRAIINIRELSLVLEKYHFILVDTALLSLNEQISLFSDAKIVVGIHGAGLANLLFAPKGVSVVEIFHSSSVLPSHYKQLSVSLGHNYSYLVGSCSLNDLEHFTLDSFILENKLKELTFDLN